MRRNLCKQQHRLPATLTMQALRFDLARTSSLCPAHSSKIQRRQLCRVSVRAVGNGADGRLDAEKQREIAKMLLTTQKNMLALNNSRVKVQEELAVANRRIADLEREVERLRAEAAAAQTVKEAQLPPPFSAERGISRAVPPATPFPPPQQQQQYQPVQQQQQQPPPQQYQAPPQPQQYAPQQPPPQPQQQQYQAVQQQQPPQQQQQQQQVQQQPPQQPQPPPQQAPPNTINITYVSGWHNAFIHFTVDGKSWTNVPGMRLQPKQNEHNTKTIVIEGSRIEFVMNNGENDWDSPGRYTDKPRNYEITSPGSYRLKSGKLEKLS